MKSYASLAALPLLATATNALGIVDMAHVAVKLATQAIDLDGDYYIQNVKTGKYMYFDRPGDTTNLVTGDSKTPVTIGKDSKYGQSGVNWDHWQGSYFQGLDKCMSAQWGIENDVGVDLAAVSYACKVGELASDGTDSLEVAKQFWHAIPCSSSSSSDSSSPSSDSSSSSSDSSSSSSSSNVQLNAKVASSGSKAASTADFQSANSGDATTTTTSSAPAASQSVDPNNRWTWVCRHPAWWLARHPDYVWEAGHVECQNELMDYYNSLGRMHKRSRHSKREHLGFGENPNKLSKRADATYCIVAVDHITDMDTRALTAESIDTAGGYSSLKLANLNQEDDAMHWRITKAN
ncbi:hypothetical protein JCM10213v2_007560 [Rhodosporidiobolus nylandii]